MRAQPLVAVKDVEKASRWYQTLLGCKSAHGGVEYERLVDPGLHTSVYGSDGLILQLHSWEVEHHHGRDRRGGEGAVWQRRAAVVRGG